MLGITPNEATLVGAFGGAALGAILGGVVSFFTTRYIVKHGPDYSAQISGTNEALAAIAVTQEEMKKQYILAVEAEAKRHQEAANQAQAARWKPTVKILSNVQGSAQVNLLRLESSQEFALLEACLLSPSGAKIADYPVNGPKVRSTGFSVPITHETLVKIANSGQPYFQTSSFDAAIRFVVQCAGHPGTYSADIPIHAEMTPVANTLFFKLTG
jgi:hypothetical protein